MARVKRLRLAFAEGSDVPPVEALVVKRGISGPWSEKGYWIVRTPPTEYLPGRGLSEYLVIGPGNRVERLEDMDEGKDVFYVNFWHEEGNVLELDRFSSLMLTHFAKGVVEVIERVA